MLYGILDDDGAGHLDAKVELEGTAVLLHSRGGAAGGRPPRNPDYQKAFRKIISRLRGEAAANPAIDRILLDSTVGRRLPENERVLLEVGELARLSNEEAAATAAHRARGMGQAPDAKGGNSTKALRIETFAQNQQDLISLLRLVTWTDTVEAAASHSRLANSDQRRVTASNIGQAVFRLLSGELPARFDLSKDYDVLLDDGTRLAPKQVFALALEEALNIEIHPSHFSAGWGQPCFDLIQAAGFRIVHKRNAGANDEQFSNELATRPPDEGDKEAAEGNLKVVTHIRRERASGLAQKKKAAFLAEHGRLYCERCLLEPAKVYGVAVGNACIEVHHASVQVKDMEAGHVTRLEDLQCLCANCHRVTHKELASSWL
ncbi:hypothetical protein ABAC460_17850 [Asticcacaulis sp. AC460]|uniref:HNH endonuclease n=1 Tax=Asticcacaulis sp. AC460 TaxID=1282360 RepID=UPI0003C3DF62|nr:HNH endonuclease [Asticcacaulis sp. AC460]ESQ88057.1 hypothetical protein ABAC460_17850 [Asticcacaulis sp. AC460]